ncbi:MMPL family transporter [Allokutzneria albata]|uniref:Putative drug exporter of the RND superfamily n=1 Tax=Allokutzneria albata TaxID=211114 RepID=A0A1G9ZW15_ALLAB|nr:MMPL family transporter [Allokutzneria albata]SDN25304.1 putative drug exporter of the RND superfamily [Allokutzneria albata]
MFVSWGSVVHRRRWLVAIAIVLFTVVGGAWGAGVFGQLSQGGYEDPGSEAARATATAKEALGRQGGDLAVIYTVPTGTVDDQANAAKITDRLRALPADKVERTLSYWDTRAPQFADAEKKRGIAVITLRSGDENEKISQYPELRDKLQVDGVRTEIAGFVPMAAAINETTQTDLIKAELVSVPLTLILLVVIFGGLVAASLPVAVGGLAILGSLGVIRIISSFTEVSTFAVNVASLLGLGLAIDYGLFMVGRFREEIAAGRATPDAVRRTVATAGRTVAFSATLLVIALAGLLLFPQGFLKSVAYGGMAAVGIAALVSLTLLPALLAMLGKKVDSLGLPWRKNKRAAAEDGRGWHRLASGVMRRPALVAVPIVAGLLLLGAPFLGASFGAVTEKVLPASNATRQATETLNANFPGLANDGAQLVIKSRDGSAPDQRAVASFAASVDNVPGVSAVQVTGAAKDVVTLSAKLPGDAMGSAAKDAIGAIRAVSPPPNTDLLVGGITAQVTDSLDAIIEQLPLMAIVVIGATLLLMFLAFGSLLLPVKAVVMSALSLSATFGVLVWVFQDGHLADLIGVTPGPLEAGIVVLMAAVVFGLSTDYEVFLMSRMVEAKTKGAGNAEAVATGIAKTGRVISAAAILLIVVTGAFAFSDVAMMRFVGVGMILALVLDATIVRMLLVPAVMRLLGNAAWWAPGPLRRLQQRVGLQESDDLPEDAETSRSPQPVG